MRIVWSPTAMRHLAEIRRYIARHNPQAAGRTAGAVRQAVAALRDFPGIGRVGRVPDTRELTIATPPYVVPYTVRGEIIKIHAVLHGARKWPDHFGGWHRRAPISTQAAQERSSDRFSI